MSLLLWILAAVLTAGVVIPLAAVLAGPRRDGPGAAGGEAADGAVATAEVYRRQLADLKAEVAAGRLPAAAAVAEEAELSRRLLAAADPDDRPEDSVGGAPAPPPDRPARRLGLIVMGAVPAAALGLYLWLGSPGLPSEPFAQRDPALIEAQAVAVAAAEALAQRLATDGGSVADWMDLGSRWRTLGRTSQAVTALARAVGQSDGDPDALSAYGEALVDDAGGIVTEPAIETFQEVLDARPADPRARFYLALGRAQAGDRAAALGQWQALMRDTPADAPWLGLLIAHIRDTADALGQDPDEAVPDPAAPVGAAGPDAADMAAVSALPADQQAAMIEGMVSGLAARLAEAPGDVDGWLRLAQAYGVLGRRDDQFAALESARAAAPDDLRVLEAESAAHLADWGEAGPTETALRALDRLLQADPDNPLGLWQLAQLSEVAGAYDRAASIYARLLEVLPPDDANRAAVADRLATLEAVRDSGGAPDGADGGTGPQDAPAE